MEAFGFFQLPFAATTEPSVNSRASNQKPQPSPNTQHSATEQPKNRSISQDDITEMANNPVFWMMP
ncbi:hypothetical protein [Leptolyngbya sp. FACHB-8]|uniref:hypothetical protein n=1 Tax=unclassified Leptolyngbya TaxID=2650499 RepID=UPI001685CD3E|nr:hypothetical protein [Leptolyngbya sp. FACHB-8]MBD2154479.1 hypothetical protein [Leptolyngbya sp. FACHB-16]